MGSLLDETSKQREINSFIRASCSKDAPWVIPWRDSYGRLAFDLPLGLACLPLTALVILLTLITKGYLAISLVLALAVSLLGVVTTSLMILSIYLIAKDLKEVREMKRLGLVTRAWDARLSPVEVKIIW